MCPRMAQMDFHLWLHMRAHLKSVFLRYEPSVSNRKLKNTYDMLLYYLEYNEIKSSYLMTCYCIVQSTMQSNLLISNNIATYSCTSCIRELLQYLVIHDLFLIMKLVNQLQYNFLALQSGFILKQKCSQQQYIILLIIHKNFT